MKMKKTLAAAVACTVLAAGAPAAQAFEPPANANPNFQPGEPGASITGSSLADVSVIGGGVLAGLAALGAAANALTNGDLVASARQFLAQFHV